MSSLLTASIVFVGVFAGSSFGQWLSPRLPEHHRTSESHDAVKLTTGMISILAALVLGLLTASVKNAFDATDSQIRQFASTLIMLNETRKTMVPRLQKRGSYCAAIPSAPSKTTGRRKARPPSRCPSGWRMSAAHRTWNRSVSAALR